MILAPLENSASLWRYIKWIQVRPVVTHIFNDKDTRGWYEPFGLRGHNGIDFRAKVGTPIFASFDGVIKFKNDGDKGYGRHIKIRSAEKGLECVYGHLSKVRVNSGETVHQGDFLGLTGNTGFSKAQHLHFGIRFLEKGKGNVFNWKVRDYDNGFHGWVDPTPYLICYKGTLTRISIK